MPCTGGILPGWEEGAPTDSNARPTAYRASGDCDGRDNHGLRLAWGDSMAMDLSVGRGGGDVNNNCNAVVDLSLPRKDENEEVVGKEVMEEVVEEATAQTSLQQLLKLSGNAKALESLLPLSTGKALESLLPNNGKTLESLLPSLDMTALNLLCLARLQETAAALLPGRSPRPLPAHLPSSMFGLGSHSSIVSSSSSSCHLQRRTHRCEQPGCDKVG